MRILSVSFLSTLSLSMVLLCSSAMSRHTSPVAEAVVVFPEEREGDNPSARKRARTVKEEPSSSSSTAPFPLRRGAVFGDIPTAVVVHAVSFLDDSSGRVFKRTSHRNSAVVDLYHTQFFNSFGNNRFTPLPYYRGLIFSPILMHAFNFVWELLVESTPPATQHAYIEELVNTGERGAISSKHHGLRTGLYGYKKNLVALHAFIEQEANLRRYRQATEWKLDGLNHGFYGYTKDPDKAKKFINAEIMAGNPEAVRLKMLGLKIGFYGYEEDLPALRTLIEEQVVVGNDEAIVWKMQGLDRGVNGYERNPEALRAFINAQVVLRNPEAIQWKMEGLRDGKFGFPQDHVALNALIEEQISLENSDAGRWKIEGLSKGAYGFPEDPAAAKTLIEREIALGNRKAIKWKDAGLCHGQYGYERDPEAAEAFRAAYPSASPLGIYSTIYGKLREINKGSLSRPDSHTTLGARIDYLKSLGDPLLRGYLDRVGSVEKLQAVMAARSSPAEAPSAPASADSSGSSSKEQEAVAQ
jgi:hypothetical protein